MTEGPKSIAMTNSRSHTIASLLTLRSQLCQSTPDPSTIPLFVESTLRVLFPQLSPGKYRDERSLGQEVDTICSLVQALLNSVVKENTKLLGYSEEFIDNLPHFHHLLREDAEAILHGDPAAKSIDEVILAYPGFLAIAVYRIAHWFHCRSIPTLPRMISEHAHKLTGIDIHPGATIGRSFVIDHGTGIVIGETTVIHDNVKIYQGVTLGALSVEKSMANMKRHPTIERDVVIYANATILGGSTVIGAGSVIGGNVWLTESVSPGSRVYHAQARS